jgi:hypothetical protein
LNFQDSYYIKTISILGYSKNDVLVLKSDGSIDHWRLSNQNLTYSGGFYTEIYDKKHNEMVVYSTIIFLPLQDIIYIGYKVDANVTGYYFKLSSLPEVN